MEDKFGILHLSLYSPLQLRVTSLVQHNAREQVVDE